MYPPISLPQRHGGGRKFRNTAAQQRERRLLTWQNLINQLIALRWSFGVRQSSSSSSSSSPASSAPSTVGDSCWWQQQQIDELVIKSLRLLSNTGSKDRAVQSRNVWLGPVVPNYESIDSSIYTSLASQNLRSVLSYLFKNYRTTEIYEH